MSCYFYNFLPRWCSFKLCSDPVSQYEYCEVYSSLNCHCSCGKVLLGKSFGVLIIFMFITDLFGNHLQAIGARNLLKSISKQREAQQQQLVALITEKKMQLER